ncbi:MAG: hypothetical protein GY868_19625 [Deltaproteobacteria bacterium]|nr:hypothetical protein [Deltaproteobacteria bacterium]
MTPYEIIGLYFILPVMNAAAVHAMTDRPVFCFVPAGASDWFIRQRPVFSTTKSEAN